MAEILVIQKTSIQLLMRLIWIGIYVLSESSGTEDNDENDIDEDV